MSRIDAFLELVVKQGGSDLHLVSGQEPRVRLHGALHSVRFRELSSEDMERILGEFMDERVWETFQERKAVDFAYEVEGLGRFRVNAYYQRTGPAAALRLVPSKLQTLDELGLPSTVARAITQSSGLVLVTGPTGSGKSTTLAAMIDHINSTQRGHIITIEDPIEVVHQYKKSVVTQRQVGLHAPSFAEALRSALREDPDVILVGEMRDAETIALALTASETGVQVLGTLHTNGATRTIDRIINVFPVERQEQVRTMLAESLKVIVSQQLVRNVDGTGRVIAAEVLINSHAAATMIRSGRAHQLTSVIQAGGKLGMRSLDAQLSEMIRNGVITGDEAHKHGVDKAQFERFLTRTEAA